MTGPDCTIVRHPLAEAITALAVTAGGPAVTGARYPAALRAEAAQLTESLCDPDTAAALGGRIAEAGLYPTLSALMRRHGGDSFGTGPDATLAALLDDVASAVDATRVPARADDDERLLQMHRRSEFLVGDLFEEPPAIRLWPIRLLPPAPAGKLFARSTSPTVPLQMAFGDIGQVGGAGTLNWPQWYRLGVWHACLNRMWAGPVAQTGDSRLDEAFAAVPEWQKVKAAAYESAVHRQQRWAPYFLDNLVGAAKIVLEAAVGGPQSADDQQRWLRSLGRVHIDWFVEQVRTDGVRGLDLAKIADRWLLDVERLHDVADRFAGPLSACENPLWADTADVVFSPSIARSGRRSLMLWLRSQWPGEVRAADDDAAPAGNRLVYALGSDTEWLASLEETVRPADRARWRALAGGPGLLYAHRQPGTDRRWIRVAVGRSVDDLVRLQQLRRPFADWTAIDGDDQVTAGHLDVVDDHVTFTPSYTGTPSHTDTGGNHEQ